MREFDLRMVIRQNSLGKFGIFAVEVAMRAFPLITTVPGLVLAGLFSGASAHDLHGQKAQSAQEATFDPKVVQELRDREALRDPGVAVQALSSVAAPSVAAPQASPGAPSPAAVQLDHTLEQLMNARARWPHHTTLVICFLDGSASSRQAFLTVMKEEVDLTNLKLDPSANDCAPSDHAQIRVSFAQPGYWSYIGTDALLIPRGSPTLNLTGMGGAREWLDTNKGTARHEIGHALALLHEHQNPQVDCGFKSNAEIAALLGWSESEVAVNFDPVRARPGITITTYDPTSIMHYQLSPDYFKDGANAKCYIERRNNVLSPADSAFLSRMYPKE